MLKANETNGPLTVGITIACIATGEYSGLMFAAFFALCWHISRQD